jgi:hemerythrin-like domain-containing protein
MTDPLSILEEEHAVIRRVLSVIEQETVRIDAGALPAVDLISLAIEFFAGFADRRHHGKEEDFLFPMLAMKKDIIRDGPIKVLRGEHESGRYFVRELREGLAQLEAGQRGAADRIRRALFLYARMLHKHIAKEEEIVFLLARVLLSEGEMQLVAREFQGADQDAGDASLSHFLATVERLELLSGGARSAGQPLN